MLLKMTKKFIKNTIYIASDHAGFTLKKYLIINLQKINLNLIDLGTDTKDISVDYPDFAQKMATKIDENSFGILICGSGIGIAISANRNKNIRAALCHNKVSANLARGHNDANVLCLGARFLKQKYALAICKTFLTKKFDGKRHIARVEKLGK